ncbi:MAG TPA: hypothetical protein PLE24_01560 [Chitinispirillaceae bacterium]|jgi:hypothetical protein|nr:hypothetical protein [Chitinispirillaceae bacterium]
MSIKKPLSSILISSVLLFTMCSSNPAPVYINQSDLYGIWIAVELEESWYFPESDKSGSETETITDSSMFLLFDSEKLSEFSYDPDDGCFHFESKSYSISRNNLFADGFSGSEDGCDWSTTLELDGNSLTVSTTYYEEESYEKSETTYKKYTGTFLPESWPEEMCMNKKANRKISTTGKK